MANQELSEQEIVRRRSLEALRERGIDPYPAAEYPVSGYSREIKKKTSMTISHLRVRLQWQGVS